jgi:hypothetical protein
LAEGLPSGEQVDALLRAVAEHWNDIIGRADEEQADRLRAIIAGTAEPDPVEARAALGDELIGLLPPDHPVIGIMRTTTMYSASGPDAGSRLAGALRWLRAQVGAGAAPPAPAEPAELSTGAREELDAFDRQVRARLLSVPSLTAEDVRRSDVDPGGRGLIRLAGPDRQVRLPAFQFAPDGRPWPIVLEVNERLGAATDPWGVTCWWVDPHQRLAASPRELLQRNSDDLLRWAAAAVGED